MDAKLMLALLFVWLSLRSCDIIIEARCIAKDREALLAFKGGLTDDDDDGHGMLSSWEQQKDCCSWYGVQCSNAGYVIGLKLIVDNNGSLRGDHIHISPALLELDHLSYLELSGIGNTSLIPFPNFIGSMKTLRNLTLYSCGLSGTVPEENLGNLTNLVLLDLSYNSLTFENLSWLSRLPSLSDLVLSGNRIHDANWPQKMLMIHSLKLLRLSNCQLNDGESSSKEFLMNSSSTLSTVDLSFNFLTLATLHWLSNIKTLISIDVSRNQLDGLIPDSLIRNLTSLEKLLLSYNKLEGVVVVVPTSLENHSHSNSSSNLITLDLSWNQLRQPLVELIGNLSCNAMEYLYLEHNQLSGPVPEFSSCRRMRELKLGNNKLERLPRSFGRLSQLEFLDISNNSLQGNISKSTFMNLGSLIAIDLSFNDALYISPRWNPPTKLQALLVRYVKLDPQFPTWIQVLRSIVTLDISYTGISDQLPSWIWNFSTNLSNLFISHNKIRGTIPNLLQERLAIIDVGWNLFFGSLPQLNYTKVLKLSHNELSGPITPICNARSLRWLDLSYNKFVGEIPNCWDNMSTDLKVLNLGNNNFSGQIPQSLGLLGSLQTLYLNDNGLSGEFPLALKNCKYLQLIDVGGNKLAGHIPNWIGANYKEMKYLVFRQNGFDGEIPRQVCYLTQIRVLDLSMNNLSGQVPRCLDNITSLVQMTTADDIFTNGIPSPVFVLGSWEGRGYRDYPYILSRSGDRGYSDYPYVSVQWKTNESKYQKTLWLLKLLDLSSNKLNGSIPRELFRLKELVSLNLSRNNLEGKIAQEIGEMAKLESLDVSRNQLGGEMPSRLGQLNFLQVMDVSYNRLTGRIPWSTQLQSFDESVYGGNAGLCGRPLAVVCPMGDGDADGFIMSSSSSSSSFTQDWLISIAVGFIVGFWGLILLKTYIHPSSSRGRLD
ncbi:receptor-like protein EIX2 [Andrographis paniculata]|uniref:receptor-like protein EIX2 n=1 Tax=Andrographis paniculata TaxID=175694 RepID=UPI0021E9937F|nr:receptor-like protein EIX2 [Andrographis paniculata]